MGDTSFVKWLCGVIGGLMGAFLGPLDGLIYALICCCIIDYVTGVARACYNKNLSSAIGYKGIIKKVSIFCLIAVGHIVDTHLFKQGAVFRTAVTGFYIANEGISIIENVGAMGLPIPKKLKAVLEQLKEENNDENEGD